MSSEIYTLPEGFGIGSRDILIRFYSNSRPSVNNKVLFTQNLLCLPQQGVKNVHTATGQETVTNDEVLLLTSGSTLMSEYMGTDKYEAILLFFGNDTLVNFCASHGLAFHETTPLQSIFKLPQDDFLKNYCRSLRLLNEQGNTALHQLKVEEILSYISMNSPEVFRQFTAQALQGRNDIKLKQVVRLNLYKGLTTEELAFLCNMSVSTFKRHFVNLYSMPPQKYFMQAKMEQAKVLLSLQKRPSEIYGELGYENLSAFSNEFKKHFGLSPKQYRAKNEPEEKTFEPAEQQLPVNVPATL